MKPLFSWTSVLRLLLLSATKFYSADCFDPLDPNGNITVTFDIHRWTSDGYVVRVTIQNNYQYRHVEKPGWQLGWAWTHDEVIWSMTGALATQQGNCSSYALQTAHCCKRDPVIVDLMPYAPLVNRTENCCRGGLLSAWAVDPPQSTSSFEMMVGNLGAGTSYMPQNLTFMGPGPGYTCSPFADTTPTLSTSPDLRREEQVFRTWKSTCTYSSFMANKAPSCCVSLSAFYSPAIIPCPPCSCSCRPGDDASFACVGDGLLAASSPDSLLNNLQQCTDHMCPVQVHWHIKTNYIEHWRVKLTVSNYKYGLNYSDWNVIVQHPGFNQPFQSYSFNDTSIHSVADTGVQLIDDVALFWGLDHYNTVLLNASEGQPGSVTSEILLSKDRDSFTLRNGWAFPRRIYFNGDNCEMPMPDDFPALPYTSTAQKHSALPPLLLLPLLLFT